MHIFNKAFGLPVGHSTGSLITQVLILLSVFTTNLENTEESAGNLILRPLDIVEGRDERAKNADLFEVYSYTFNKTFLVVLGISFGTFMILVVV